MQSFEFLASLSLCSVPPKVFSAMELLGAPPTSWRERCQELLRGTESTSCLHPLRRAPHAPGPKRLLPRPAPSCRGRQWFKTCYSLLLFLLTLASRISSQRDHPHADTRSGIDASWLVCRGAGYPPRLRSSPRMAQESLISSSVSSFLLFILLSQK